MKKRVGLLMLTCTLLLSGVNVQAAEKITFDNFSEYLDSFVNEFKGSKGDDTLSSLMESAEELVGDIKPEDIKKLINFIDKQIQDGKWDSEKGIKEAISEGEKEFNVKLTEEQKNQILSMISKIKKLGIDPEYILEQAEKIYEKYGKELKEEADNKGKEVLKETQDKIKEEVSKSFTDYFSDMVQSVKSFFKGIFKK